MDGTSPPSLKVCQLYHRILDGSSSLKRFHNNLHSLLALAKRIIYNRKLHVFSKNLWDLIRSHFAARLRQR